MTMRRESRHLVPTSGSLVLETTKPFRVCVISNKRMRPPTDQDSRLKDIAQWVHDLK